MTHDINPTTPPFNAPISGDATELTINTDDLARTDLSWLEGLTNLRRLHITGDKTSDRMIASISTLDITELILENDSRVTIRSHRSLEALEQAHDLEEIELSGNVDDISALSDLEKLRHVDVSRCNGLSDISPLIDAPNLESVTIGLRGIAFVPDELTNKVKEAVR